MQQSLFKRLLRLGIPHYYLSHQGRSREKFLSLFAYRYPELKSLPHVYPNQVDINSQYNYANTGFLHTYQFIEVEDYKGKGETCPSSHFYQNLAEAEYIVSVYM